MLGEKCAKLAEVSVDICNEVVIDRAVVHVAAFACDPDRAPQWYVNIQSVEWKSPPPLAIGSRIAFVAEFLGRTLAYTYEVTEWIPNERMVMRTAEGPFPMETTYTFETQGRDRTRIGCSHAASELRRRLVNMSGDLA